MNDFDIPIFKKSYDLYKTMYQVRALLPKQDRYALWQRCENVLLDIIEGILKASSMPQAEKIPVLEQVSAKLNLLRVLIRVAYDIRSIDKGKYAALQENIDEVGRMLGGWIKSAKGR